MRYASFCVIARFLRIGDRGDG